MFFCLNETYVSLIKVSITFMYIAKLKQIEQTIDVKIIVIMGVTTMANKTIKLLINIASIINLLYLYIVILIIFTDFQILIH